jgi:Na+-transporting methylmalonyl-CoA/oxaloacetate decarboxylase gamma subunit
MTFEQFIYNLGVMAFIVLIIIILLIVIISVITIIQFIKEERQSDCNYKNPDTREDWDD